jgi:hypothetical protein
MLEMPRVCGGSTVHTGPERAKYRPLGTTCRSRCSSIPTRRLRRTYGAANGIPILGFDRRITYVIDENGKVLKVYPSVDPSTHAIEILNDLRVADAAPPAQASPAPPATN